MAGSKCALGDQYIRDTTSFRWLYTTPTFLYSITPPNTRHTRPRILKRNNEDTMIEHDSLNQTFNYTKAYNLTESNKKNKTN